MSLLWLLAFSGSCAVSSLVEPLADNDEPAHCLSLLQTGSIMQAGSRGSHDSPQLAYAQKAIAARGGGKRAVILMSDSRPLFENGVVPATPEQAGWMQLAAAINLQYAQRHGYDFVYLTYTGGAKEWACTATLGGEEVKRHASWCKLLGMSWASAEFDDSIVAYVDSDAFFVNQGKRIEDYMRKAELTVVPNSPKSHEPRHDTSQAGLDDDDDTSEGTYPTSHQRREDCGLFTFGNGFYDSLANESKPWSPSETYGYLGNIANGGLLWWPRPFDTALLSSWWKVPRKNLDRDWEQASLNIEVIAQRPDSICTFQEVPFVCDMYDEPFMCHVSSAVVDAFNTTVEKRVYDFFKGTFSSNFTEIMYALRDLHQKDFTQEEMRKEAASLERYQ